MLDKNERQLKSPYVERIVATLKARIHSGEYPGGRWLPTERELCSEFEVSRATLRLALLELERNRLVIRSAGCRPLVNTEAARGEAGHVSAARSDARRTIGLCVKNDAKFSGTYQISQGVREAANTESLRLILGGASAVTLNQVGEQEAQALLQMAQDDDISGIVIWYCGGDANLPVLQAIQESRIPLVFVDRMPPEGLEADYVSIDNEAAARQAVQYLIQKGHTRIAHVSNPEPVSTVFQRAAGYRAALKSAGLPVDERLILTGRLEGMAEEALNANEIVERLLDLAAPPTAIFAVTDYVAMALVRELQERGIHVPDDMAVVGFDDLEQWLPHKPFLTTVRQPFARIGFEAARLLLKRIESGPASHSRHVVLDASLVVRESA